MRPFCNCRKCGKLKVNQRIVIIKEYESSRSKKPSIKSLATKYDCCFSEIKKILLNRASILAAYKSMGSSARNIERLQIQQRELADSRALERREKISFLGKAMFEYIQRVMYANYNIDDEKVIQKAWEFKHQINVDSFEPDQRWLLNFKRMYGIWSFDLKALRKSIRLTEAKEPHLSTTNIIEYVRRRAAYNQNNGSMAIGSTNHSIIKSNNGIKRFDIVEEHILPDHESQAEMPQQYSPPDDNLLEPIDNCNSEPTIVYDNAEDDSDDVIPNGVPQNSSIIITEENFATNITPPTCQPVSTTKRTSKLASIESVEEALEHLKLLEEFAMLEDNFRAIGLLTQLEQCFSKQSNNTA
ncbi:uncharacterized protein LOC133338409 [Musca vetustissima]|uniref:uncharacterized protein LOC133338409 n=1 Tax=Musca vetustissima TaxID=27455 RepID=UPI002AB628E2|nr:uncharacterized protein LOC133338409 [Musca vetustissima]